MMICPLTRPAAYVSALLAAISSAGLATAFAEDQTANRCGPKFLQYESDRGTLLLLCEKNDTVLRMDPLSGEIVARGKTDESPFAAATHPNDKTLYVSCRSGQSVLELDAESLTEVRRFELRGDPTGVAVSADGKRLYVGVHSLDQVAVFDLDKGVEIKRLAVGNGPETVRLAAKLGRVYVTNLLSNPVRPDQPCRNEVTIIDDASARVVDRVILDNANIGRGITFTSDEALAVVAISRPKNLVPMVQVARGWVVTNGFAILSANGERPVQLLVDLPNQAYADPYAVTFARHDSKFYVTCAGLDTVIAVDVERVTEVMREIREGRLKSASNDLGLSRRYVTARISVGANPEALALSHNGERLYVANRLDDSISVIDTASDTVADTFVIGEPRSADRLLRGERFFHSAARTFQGQFSCTSCHPDSGFDGLQYDLEPDGLGENILDNRNLRGVAGTAPFKWVGSNPDISTQCGTRTAKWIMRTGWLNSMEVVDLAAHIRSLAPVANPYRSPDTELTPAQQRGKELFERTTTNDAKPIAERNRCDFCHAGERFTDGRASNVGTKASSDSKSAFDSAHLTNIFESPPYLHDGRAATLEEIWTKFNPDDTHGVSSDWNKQQLNDLIEYMKSL